MAQKNLIYCRYYKGEKECPENFKGTSKEFFWQGEQVFITTKADIKEWEQRGREIKSQLTGEKLQKSYNYSPREFGIVIFIEELFSRHDPYDDMKWIFEY